MAQADYVIQNGRGLNVRDDINAQLEAIATHNSGPDAPAVVYPFMRWEDTAEGVLKRRNAANTAWELIGPTVVTFDTVADMKAATHLRAGQKVRTLGYYSPGDGGGNDYEIVAAGTGTDDGGSYIDLPGSGLQAKGIFQGVVNVRQFGATGDGVADDRSAIVNAIAYVGDGSLRVPAGSYSFSAKIDITDSLHLFGDGIEATIMTLTAGSGDSGLNFTGVTGGSLSSMTVIGNSIYPGGHTVRGESLTDFAFKDLILKNGGAYNLGLQNGAFVNVRVSDVTCDGSGSDAIDVKNKADGNDGLIFENLILRNFGNDDTGTTNGLDVRGKFIANNILVSDFGGRASATSSGITMRQGEPLDTNGLGAHGSVISNIQIFADTATGTRGVVSEARHCNISNVRSENCGTHIDIQQRENIISSAVMVGGTDGIIFRSAGHPSDGDRAAVSSVVIRSLSGTALDAQTVENSVSAFTIRAVDTAISVASGADLCSFGMGSISNATTGLSDSASGTRIVAVSQLTDQ